MKGKDQTIYVCLDTNVYIKCGLKFDHREHFKSFADFAQKKLVQPVIVDIIKDETINNIKKAYAKMKEGLCKPPYGPISDALSFLDTDLEARIKAFSDYLDSTNYQHVAASGQDISKVLDLYYKPAPPFEDKGQKKCEFPDAFICLALENHMKNKGGELYIVTEDQGVKKFFEAERSLKSPLKSKCGLKLIMCHLKQYGMTLRRKSVFTWNM